MEDPFGKIQLIRLKTSLLQNELVYVVFSDYNIDKIYT